MDASADGYVRSEAVGALILALAAEYNSEATAPIVILAGSAVNQDGNVSRMP